MAVSAAGIGYSAPSVATGMFGTNAVAVWATDSGNALVKTIGRWVGNASNPASANGYKGLTWWRHFTTGNGDVDGFMGATRGNYAALRKTSGGLPCPHTCHTARPQGCAWTSRRAPSRAC